mgnify:CR=1 FL=1
MTAQAVVRAAATQAVDRAAADRAGEASDVVLDEMRQEKLFREQEAEYWAEKGNAAFEQARYSEAITAYERALELAPLADDVRQRYNDALLQMDRRIGDLGNAVLITIAIADRWEDVANYFPKGTDLRVLFDPDDKIGKGIFGTVKYPETFILDKQRRIRARFDGKRPWYSEPMFDYLKTFM